MLPVFAFDVQCVKSEIERVIDLPTGSFQCVPFLHAPGNPVACRVTP
jgi:hypothetical protein